MNKVVALDDKLIFQQMRKMKAKSIEQIREDLIDIKIAENRLNNMENKVQTKAEFLKEMSAWVEE